MPLLSLFASSARETNRRLRVCKNGKIHQPCVRAPHVNVITEAERKLYSDPHCEAALLDKTRS